MSSDEQLDRLEALLAEINASELESDGEEESQLPSKSLSKSSGVELSKPELSEPSQSSKPSTDKALWSNESKTSSKFKSVQAQKEIDSKPIDIVRDSSEHTETEIKEDVLVKIQEETKSDIPVIKDAASDKIVKSSDSRPTGSVRDSSERAGSDGKKEGFPVKRHQETKNETAATDSDISFDRASSEHTESQETKNGTHVVEDSAVAKSVESSDNRPGAVQGSSENSGTDLKKEEDSIKRHQEPKNEIPLVVDAALESDNGAGSSSVKVSSEKSNSDDRTPTLDSTSRSTAAEKKKQKKARQKQRAKAAKAAGLSPSPILGSDSPLMSLDSPKIASGSPSLSVPQDTPAESPNLASQSPGLTSASVPNTLQPRTSLESGEPQSTSEVQNSKGSASIDKFENGEAKKDVAASIDSNQEDTASSRNQEKPTEPESSKQTSEHLVEEHPGSSPHERKVSSDAESECKPSKSERSDLNNSQQTDQGSDANHGDLEKEKTLGSSVNSETDSSGGTPKAVSIIPDSLGISLPTTPNKLLHSDGLSLTSYPSVNAETRENATHKVASVSQSQTLKDEPELAELHLKKLPTNSKLDAETTNLKPELTEPHLEKLPTNSKMDAKISKLTLGENDELVSQMPEKGEQIPLTCSANPVEVHTQTSARLEGVKEGSTTKLADNSSPDLDSQQLPDSTSTLAFEPPKADSEPTTVSSPGTSPNHASNHSSKQSSRNSSGSGATLLAVTAESSETCSKKQEEAIKPAGEESKKCAHTFENFYSGLVGSLIPGFDEIENQKFSYSNSQAKTGPEVEASTGIDLQKEAEATEKTAQKLDKGNFTKEEQSATETDALPNTSSSSLTDIKKDQSPEASELSRDKTDDALKSSESYEPTEQPAEALTVLTSTESSPKTDLITEPKAVQPASKDEANTVYLYMSLASGVRGSMSRFNKASTILKSYDIEYVPIEITLDERAKRLWKLKGVSKNKVLPAVFRDGDMKCDFNELVEANEIEDVEDLIFDGL